MRRQHALQVIIATMLFMLVLIGCGESTTTAAVEDSAERSEPEQAATTPTLEPPTATQIIATATPVPSTPTPLPPTAIPTLEIPKPQPGAHLQGSIEVGEKAGSGAISFTVLEDGLSIDSVGILLIGPFECPGISMAKGGLLASGLNQDSLFPIIEGNIDTSRLKGGELTGYFTSPTEASGTINFLGLPVEGIGECDWGTLNWTAKAQ